MKQILALLILLASALAASAITIDTVPVGDVGNPNDPANGGDGNHYGGVNYEYRIGKYEVTVTQYAAFLNAVAVTDTYGLYNQLMSPSHNRHVGGIDRSSTSGSYAYTVVGSPNHPVAPVSWEDAARFTNWLHNGQPTGLEDSSTTENGAYTLNGATTQQALNAITRNANATWFIPSENEWYKAAYYQPAAQGGDADNYWRYAMRTNSAPYSDQPPGATPNNTRVGNFAKSDGIANGYDDGYAVTGSGDYLDTVNYLTDVGAYTASPSYYGTYDQTGNVWERTEGIYPLADGTNYRVSRGGSYYSIIGFMENDDRSQEPPNAINEQDGFRVASIAVPEPSTILLAITAFTALPIRRRKSVPHNRV